MVIDGVHVGGCYHEVAKGLVVGDEEGSGSPGSRVPSRLDRPHRQRPASPRPESSEVWKKLRKMDSAAPLRFEAITGRVGIKLRGNLISMERMIRAMVLL